MLSSFASRANEVREDAEPPAAPAVGLRHRPGPLGPRLVFDIGANYGQSSERYLAQGFRVVAVEPNPACVEAMRRRLRSHVESGRLCLDARAVAAAPPGSKVKLYVNAEDSEWSSLLEAAGRRYDTEAEVVDVGATTLSELYAEHGAPHYVKIDVEGGDGDCLRQLRGLPPPPYLSFELNSLASAKHGMGAGLKGSGEVMLFKLVQFGGPIFATPIPRHYHDINESLHPK